MKGNEQTAAAGCFGNVAKARYHPIHPVNGTGKRYLQGLNPGRTVRVREPPLRTSEVAAIENFSVATFPSELMVSCVLGESGLGELEIGRWGGGRGIAMRCVIAHRSTREGQTVNGTSPGVAESCEKTQNQTELVTRHRRIGTDVTSRATQYERKRTWPVARAFMSCILSCGGGEGR